jgi:hypothetical protein
MELVQNKEARGGIEPNVKETEVCLDEVESV